MLVLSSLVSRKVEEKHDKRRLKDNLLNKFEHSEHWSDEMWQSRMAGGGAKKKIFQYCTDPSEQEILYLRALQDHSGSNLIDPKKWFFLVHFPCRMGKQLTFHHQFRIATGKSKKLRNRQKDSILPTCGIHGQNHKDPETIDLNSPRHAQSRHKAWNKHDINLALKKGLKFY